MARKKKGGDESGGANWMDTYGDMITLVLTFFVLLFSMSTIDAAKWEMLVATLTGTPLEVIAPLNPGRSIAPDPTDQQPEPMTPEQIELQRQENQKVQAFQELYERMMELVRANQLESMLLVEKSEDMIDLRFTDSLLFDTGRAEIREDARGIILQAVAIFEETQDAINMIHIEGHTDNRPISNDRFRNNWDLSAMRASSVLAVVEENTTIDPIKFSVGGYGETRPIDTNDTDEGRARNRRVDIQIERDVIDVGYNPYPDLLPVEEQTPPRTQDLWDEISE